MGRLPYFNEKFGLGYEMVESGSWPSLPWWRKCARWLRVVPKAHLAGWLAWVRHDVSRCMIVHQPCPSEGCEHFSKATVRRITYSVRSSKLDHYWERVKQRLERNAGKKSPRKELGNE